MSRSVSRSPPRRRSRSPRDRRSSSMGDKYDLNGVVTRITDRGFGFIDVDGMDEVFFHSNDIVDNIDIRQMREGDKVMLDLVPSIKKRDRYDAKNVRPDDPDTKNREEVGRRPSPRRRRSPPR